MRKRLVGALAFVALAACGALGTDRLIAVSANCVGLECKDQPSCGPDCFCNTSGDGTCHSKAG